MWFVLTAKKRMTKHWLIVLMMPVSFLFACNKSNNADNTNELKDSAATSDSMYKPALLLNLPDSMNRRMALP